MVKSEGYVWKEVLEFPSEEISNYISHVVIPHLYYPHHTLPPPATPEILKTPPGWICGLSTPSIPAMTIPAFHFGVTKGRSRLRISLLECVVMLLRSYFSSPENNLFWVGYCPSCSEGRGAEKLLSLVNQLLILKDALILIASPFNSSWKQQGSYKSYSQN